ncbi:hypothetical protein ACLOJK_016734 [Asimina triloba]
MSFCFLYRDRLWYSNLLSGFYFMARTFLQPGIRFSPTDVELVMYYLRRKVNNKRFPSYEIPEVKLYEFAPWELNEKPSLPSGDLVRFFFCSRQRKYASGKRTNRATKYGFWKTTGQDKAISHKSKTVGWRKTLIFHEGKPPGGKRTDWVNHEYRIEDDRLINEELTVIISSQDSYVLCKIFQKSGRGPKNGEQHGAPYNEDEWEDNYSERNATSITVPLDGPSSTALWPEASEVLAVTRAAESVDMHNFVLDQSALGPEVIQNLAMNGTAESIRGHDSVIDQLAPGPEESEILAGNGREDSVDGHNLFMDQLLQQSGAPVVNKTHDSSLADDNVELFDVNQLLSEIGEEGGSCIKEKLDAPTHQENGNKDVMLDGHDFYGDLGELISNEDLNNLPFVYDPSEIYLTLQDGSFLEQDDLEPMQDDDLFGNGTNGDLHVHSSTMNIPASQETQDAIQYLATAPAHNAEETAAEYIPPSSARGERHDELSSLDCIPPASAAVAGSPYFTVKGHSKNVLSHGSMFHIRAEVILFWNKSSHLPCMHSRREKPGTECSLHFTGRQELQIHSIVSVGVGIDILSRIKIRKALGAVKDKTSIGLAKAGNNVISDLEVAIIKATRHEELPAEERHVREILSITSYSHAYVSACVGMLARRLNKTRNWTVALKTLMLIHRLLSDGDPACEQEIFFSTRRGTRLLNMSDFRDTSRSGSWDFSAFVRTYALYLDERLEFRMHGRRHRRKATSSSADQDEEDGHKHSKRSTPVRGMKIEKIFTRTQHLQQLLERLLACRPTGKHLHYDTIGAAKANRVVLVALYPVVKESFQTYYDITEIMGILIDRFMELEVIDCVKVYDIFTRISKQFDDLDAFYSWCKTVGIARSSEYPEVERITSKKLEVMDEFIRDKSALLQSRRARELQKEQEAEYEELKVELTEEEPAAMLALPPPETTEEEAAPEEEAKEEKEGEKEEKADDSKEEADLLHLRDDLPTEEEQGDRVALALFNGEEAAVGTPAWQAFSDDADWETALVQSESHLSNQKAALPGGFDMLLLDGMYQQACATAAVNAASAYSGSASSVALPSSKPPPEMLALPAPPVAGVLPEPAASASALASTSRSTGTVSEGGDPFAASTSVPPPSYVQMTDMEKKQQLLVEEQLLWQQYARDGMQGQLALQKLQNSPYRVGANPQPFLA